MHTSKLSVSSPNQNVELKPEDKFLIKMFNRVTYDKLWGDPNWVQKVIIIRVWQAAVIYTAHQYPEYSVLLITAGFVTVLDSWRICEKELYRCYISSWHSHGRKRDAKQLPVIARAALTYATFSVLLYRAFFHSRYRKIFTVTMGLISGWLSCTGLMSGFDGILTSFIITVSFSIILIVQSFLAFAIVESATFQDKFFTYYITESLYNEMIEYDPEKSTAECPTSKKEL